ncbi:MAG TPA: DUF1835 domain-containing protein [Flavisolibacter sp.]|nr:DUF1835 domain-containing protein [Flavisolibacter sp.]
MIHVVFQQADVHTLKKAIELDETLSGDIIQIRDDFAVGPIENLDTEEGWTAREAWWRSLLNDSPYSNENLVGSFDDRKTVEEIKQRLNENEKEELWIWMGQNQHDVCSYYWIISQLKDYQGKVVVLYFNNLPFINEKGQIFYPTSLHEILPKEFLKAKKLNRKVTLSELEVDPDEWKRLCHENAMVRILEGGKKIVGKEDAFYDKEVQSGLSSEWQKGNRAMQSVLGKMKIKTGDVFLLWRMKKLAEEGKIEINGSTSKNWKDFEIRLKASNPEVAETNNPVA